MASEKRIPLKPYRPSCSFTSLEALAAAVLFYLQVVRNLKSIFSMAVKYLKRLLFQSFRSHYNVSPTLRSQLLSNIGVFKRYAAISFSTSEYLTQILFQVVTLLSQVQENCSLEEAKLLDRAMEFLKREGLYSPQFKDIKPEDPVATDLIGALLTVSHLYTKFNRVFLTFLYTSSKAQVIRLPHVAVQMTQLSAVGDKVSHHRPSLSKKCHNSCRTCWKQHWNGTLKYLN